MFESLPSEGNELILEYCRKCGCSITQDIKGFGFVVRDKKRAVTVTDLSLVMQEATKLHKIHKLEEQLENEPDYRKRRKIRSKLYCWSSSSGRAGD